MWFGDKSDDAITRIPDPNDRSWMLLDKVVSETMTEQRRARRWGILFRALTFAYIIVALFLFAGGKGAEDGGIFSSAEDHTAVIKIHGVIAEDKEASAATIIKGLRNAFEAKHAKAVILAINSPGGSPVQAGYVYDEIRRLRVKYPDKKVYSVISDIGASGGYYIAVAADSIYAHESSLVGSIGVTSAGFGFVGTLEKLGIERRDYTSGDHKSFLDPFQPQKLDEVVFWQDVLDSTHEQFIRKVKEGRGTRLNADAATFSGLIWNGEQALQRGLIDGLGSAGSVARDVVGAETLVNYTVQPNPLESLLGGMGVKAGSGAAQYVLEHGGAVPTLK